MKRIMAILVACAAIGGLVYGFTKIGRINSKQKNPLTRRKLKKSKSIMNHGMWNSNKLNQHN